MSNPLLSTYDFNEDDEGQIRLFVNTNSPYFNRTHAAREADRLSALIAAAPDMLEALNWALTRFADNAQYDDEDAACIEAVRAAIAKAEGGTT